MYTHRNAKNCKICTIYSTVHSFAGDANPLVPKVDYRRCRVCDTEKTNVNGSCWSSTRKIMGGHLKPVFCTVYWALNSNSKQLSDMTHSPIFQQQLHILLSISIQAIDEMTTMEEHTLNNKHHE